MNSLHALVMSFITNWNDVVSVVGTLSRNMFAPGNRNGWTAKFRVHRFDMICNANGIEHRLTKPNHPWTNGQVERMNRTIKDATVKRFHYDDHAQLETHLTPYEYICKVWTSEPDRFILNPIHQMPGLNI